MCTYHRFNFPVRKQEIQEKVSNPQLVSSHSFLPLVKVLIKTPRYKYQEEEGHHGLETKVRPISFASHFDTYLYGFYSFALGEKYQEYIRAQGFGSCILAYRSDLDGKCNIQFAKEIFDHIKTTGPCTAIALDIKGYFDSIDHHSLKDSWCKILGVPELPEDQYAIFRSLTKYTYINKYSVLRHFNINLKRLPKSERPATLTDIIPGNSFNEKFNRLREENLFVVNNSHEPQRFDKKRFYGIPQGSALSALLSNVYLIDFDKSMQEYGVKEGFLYRRYCDDILIIAPSEKALVISDSVRDKILQFHLIIQSKKTEIIKFAINKAGKLRGFDLKKMASVNSFTELADESQFYKNLQYLGFEFSGQNVCIRPGSLSRYFRKMKARIKRSVAMWKGKRSKSPKLFKQQLFHRYTHLGKRNFLTYAYNSSKKYYTNSEGKRKEGMNSPAIRKQIAKHFDTLLNELEKRSKPRKKKKNRILR